MVYCMLPTTRVELLPITIEQRTYSGVDSGELWRKLNAQLSGFSSHDSRQGERIP
jgi:hypothetical protein